ncbi:MAG TPA: HNH endonuclease [Bacteroidota bacterium]|nr:HNH endonuclease [Bacteroidota bacterium]
MPRIRTVKPDFFRHELLQELEEKHPAAYPMLTFIGLWTVADREGRFEYRPRRLKLDVLPFLTFDMDATLQLLAAHGFIEVYEIEEYTYARIVNWERHQLVGRDEPPSEIPSPDGSITEYVRPPNVTERRRLYERDQWECQYCGRNLRNSPRDICLDHVLPLALGGSNAPENLVTSCKKCDKLKGDRTLEDAGMTLRYRGVNRQLTTATTPSQPPVNTPVNHKSTTSARGSQHPVNTPVNTQLTGAGLTSSHPVNYQLTTSQQVRDKEREWEWEGEREMEREGELELEHNTSRARAEPPSGEVTEDYETWCESVRLAFNEICASPKDTPWSPLNAWGARDQQHLTHRFREDFRTCYRDVFKAVLKSEFLCGGGPRAWVPEPGWFLRGNNYRRILNGDYRDDDTTRRARNAASKPNDTDTVPQRFIDHLRGITNAEDRARAARKLGVPLEAI